MKNSGQTPSKDEYSSLRAEILQWQTVRVTTLAISGTVVTGVLAFSLRKDFLESLGPSWWIIPALLLLFLACAECLTWYSGSGNRKMGTYLLIYHEGKQGWHSRHNRLSRKAKTLPDRLSLDLILGIFYLIFGVVSLVLPWYLATKAGYSIEPTTLFLVALSLILYLACLFPLLLMYPRGSYYAAKWEEVRKEDLVSEEIRTPEGVQNPHIAAARLTRIATYIGLGLIVAAALGYLLAGWFRGYALSSSLQPIFVEVLKAALIFTLIAVGGAYIKYLSDSVLEDQRQRQAWLNEHERRGSSVIDGLVEINSGFYKLRKSLESRLQPESEEAKLALRQEMLAESVDLEARYGTLKTRAIRHFGLPASDYGKKEPEELEAELTTTDNPKEAARKRLDLLGEYYDVWRHTLEQKGTRKIPSEVRKKVWTHYEALLEYLEESALEGGDRT